MQTPSGPSGSPFAEIITSLAGLHQEHHQALLDLRADHEHRFQAMMQVQQEDRELFRSLLDWEGRTRRPRHVGGRQTAGRSGSSRLLSGEAQKAAQQLPVPNLLVYADLKRAILQRVGFSPEQHRQRFRSLELTEAGRPFVLAQQLRDTCRKWLLAGGKRLRDNHQQGGTGAVHLPSPKEDRPVDLAIQLAEDQLAACSGVGEALPSISLSLSLPLSLPPPLPQNLSLSLGPDGLGHQGPAPAGGRGWSQQLGHEARPGEWDHRAGRGPRSHLLLPHANHLTHFLPLGQRGGLGRPAGVAGIWAISWIGARSWRWGCWSGSRTTRRLPPIKPGCTKYPDWHGEPVFKPAEDRREEREGWGLVGVRSCGATNPKDRKTTVVRSREIL
ncbi:uncharacterized protein LOC122135788 [Cyprinus carpio]|uniref:Uncharacterized protein LOC122135788 n=1 Tax=Cyprinus carpio TaxID=7962 RepID=A0A9Q9VVH8_CYPCA|nr:uncharacterized protein LOC122135788 [Cyprinus carpio]